jgi:AGZA family xanthine/uracil permease-like MFS transporter
MIKKFFKLEENGTTISREFVAGATTFFAMVYIIFVNPSMLEKTGMPFGAVFLATIFASVIGTLIMGLFANVPYALAPGMGLNAFFTYTVVFTMGFSWEEALAIVFICGLLNVLITVTKLRKAIIKAIPESLQHAIGGGIGLFIAYIGFKNAGFLTFTADPGVWAPLGGILTDTSTIIIDGGIVPALTDFANAGALLALFGVVLTVVLLLFKVKGAILIGIIATTIVGIPMGVSDVSFITDANFKWDIGAPFLELGDTIFAALGKRGIGSLFGDISNLPKVLLAIFAFSLSDTFDTIGTFIGTGRKSGIFTDEDLNAIENSKGFQSKMEKALFADSIATSIGALLGTSNTTTYVESAAGIEAGGRTGLTSVVTSILFLLAILISPIVGIVPAQATAPALIIVGIMMLSSFKNIIWDDFAEAVPAFFAAILMTLAYNISLGIAFGFIFYIIVKLVKKEGKEIHPILWGSAGLFVVYFILMGLAGAGLINF